MTEMPPTSDNEILAAMKEACNEFNCSPASLLLAAQDALRWQRTAVIPNAGPHPTLIDEAEISQEILADWPEWVEDMVPAGSKWERLHWPDGSITIRLVNPRALVLAAKHFLLGEEGNPARSAPRPPAP
ncbi:MAG TPA: hypothetical protein VNA25_20230 [Phycisphaerae bacterium]|nr:hypothetical protein [Phycisphaerae bacterium]